MIAEHIKIAMRRLQQFEPPEGYYLAFSGGKDSTVLLHLAKASGVKYDAHYCCEVYKEGGGSGRVVLTGIRAAESVKRGKRRMVEICMKDPSKRFVHPLIDWSELQIWSYIRSNNIAYCELYDQGFARLGCLFCPMAYYKHRQAQVRRYPRYVAVFRKAFLKLYAERKKAGAKSIDRWTDGNAMFEWWIGDGRDERGQQLMHFDSDEVER